MKLKQKKHMKKDDKQIKRKIRDYRVEAKEKDFEEELSTAERW